MAKYRDSQNILDLISNQKVAVQYAIYIIVYIAYILCHAISYGHRTYLKIFFCIKTYQVKCAFRNERLREGVTLAIKKRPGIWGPAGPQKPCSLVFFSGFFSV